MKLSASKFGKIVIYFIKEILGLIYPKFCYNCKKTLNPSSRVYFCEDCWRDNIDIIESPFCSMCGRQLNMWHQNEINYFTSEPIDMGFCDTNNKEANKPIKCRDCIRREYYFSKGFSAAVYDGIIKKCIHDFKYNLNAYLGETLAFIMITFCDKYIGHNKIDLLVPVPLAKKKYRKRGFNQSEVLSHFLGREFNIPVNTNILFKEKHTVAQVNLSRKKRMVNVKGTFGIKNSERLSGKHVMLIDDVYTTGTTLNECSRILKSSGCRDIWIFSLVRGNYY